MCIIVWVKRIKKIIYAFLLLSNSRTPKIWFRIRGLKKFGPDRCENFWLNLITSITIKNTSTLCFFFNQEEGKNLGGKIWNVIICNNRRKNVICLLLLSISIMEPDPTILGYPDMKGKKMRFRSDPDSQHTVRLQRKFVMGIPRIICNWSQRGRGHNATIKSS